MKTITLATLLLAAVAAFSGRPAAADVVDGEPTIDTSSDTGLYVWRASTGRWHARLVAGNDGRSFEGRFETGNGASNLSRVALEWNDSAGIAQQSDVNVDFHVTDFDVDGVAFDTGWNSTVCLRRTAGTSQVLLGQNATPASLPVALSGSAACSSGSVSDSGLYVYRDANGLWNLRLKSESEAAEFSGTFEATKSVNWMRHVSLEPGDSATKTSWNTVSMALSAWPVGEDGVDISLPDGAGACLRTTAAEATTVYLGRDAGSAVAAKTPVDLTNSGACGDQEPEKQQANTGGRKFNSGHYIALMRGNDSQSVMASSIKPGVAGFLKRYTWRELEPSQGNYNFSEIASDLNYLSGQGMHLIIMIEDKTFTNIQPTPDYLSAHTRRNRVGGHTAVRWSWKIAERMKALYTALGNRFDQNPYFEGVATQETAPSMDSWVLDESNYTPESYRDRLIEVLLHGAQAMPNSRIFWFMNFLPRQQSYLSDIAAAVAPAGVIMGGPDVMPDEHALQEHTYPIYREFKDRMPLFGQVEPICYHHEHAETWRNTKYWTPSELYWYARNNLSVDYMFWVRYPKALYWNSYDYFDALPVIQNNPTFD